MKYIIIFVIIFLIFSCSNQKQITEFENILGYEESKTLTNLVEHFENNYLKKTYPNIKINEAYHCFLTDLKNTGFSPRHNSISKKIREEFDDSNLKLQIYGKPDSIWIKKSINPSLMIKWKFLTQDKKFEYSLSETYPIYLNTNNYDSIMDVVKNRIEVNPHGSYNEAINLTSYKLPFIKEYMDHRDTFGNTNPSIFINRLLDMKPNFNNYFIKRTIIIELVYH